MKMSFVDSLDGERGTFHGVERVLDALSSLTAVEFIRRGCKLLKSETWQTREERRFGDTPRARHLIGKSRIYCETRELQTSWWRLRSHELRDNNLV